MRKHDESDISRCISYHVNMLLDAGCIIYTCAVSCYYKLRFLAGPEVVIALDSLLRSIETLSIFKLVSCITHIGGITRDHINSWLSIKAELMRCHFQKLAYIYRYIGSCYYSISIDTILLHISSESGCEIVLLEI